MSYPMHVNRIEAINHARERATESQRMAEIERVSREVSIIEEKRRMREAKTDAGVKKRIRIYSGIAGLGGLILGAAVVWTATNRATGYAVTVPKVVVEAVTPALASSNAPAQVAAPVAVLASEATKTLAGSFARADTLAGAKAAGILVRRDQPPTPTFNKLGAPPVAFPDVSQARVDESAMKLPPKKEEDAVDVQLPVRGAKQDAKSAIQNEITSIGQSAIANPGPAARATASFVFVGAGNDYVMVRQGSKVSQYVKGDRLPDGKVIKSINSDAPGGVRVEAE